MTSVAAQAYGCYGVTLTRPRAAHAIALRQGQDGRLHLFDGDYGHFAVRGADGFRHFLDWYFGRTGYVTRYVTRTAIVGVKPPSAGKGAGI